MKKKNASLYIYTPTYAIVLHLSPMDMVSKFKIV